MKTAMSWDKPLTNLLSEKTLEALKEERAAWEVEYEVERGLFPAPVPVLTRPVDGVKVEMEIPADLDQGPILEAVERTMLEKLLRDINQACVDAAGVIPCSTRSATLFYEAERDWLANLDRYVRYNKAELTPPEDEAASPAPVPDERSTYTYVNPQMLADMKEWSEGLGFEHLETIPTYDMPPSVDWPVRTPGAASPAPVPDERRYKIPLYLYNLPVMNRDGDIVWGGVEDLEEGMTRHESVGHLCEALGIGPEADTEPADDELARFDWEGPGQQNYKTSKTQSEI
jgi:hypothetical protein